MQEQYGKQLALLLATEIERLSAGPDLQRAEDAELHTPVAAFVEP
jgi:hypothetical protein